MNYLKQFALDVKKYNNYIVYSAKSSLKAEVADSYLNWVWWVLEPICLMLIYTFIFGFVYAKAENYFPVFIFCGLTGWNFFSANTKQSVRMVKRYKSVISRVYLPKVMLLLSQMIVNGFKMLISFGIVVIMMLIFRVPLSYHVIYVIPILITLAIFTFGIMCIEMHFGVYIDDLANVTDIALKLLFYMTGIFFDIDQRIGKTYPMLATFLGKYNPVAFLLTGLRNSLIYNTAPELLWLLLWFVISVGMALFGICLVYRNENNYVKGI